MSRGAAELKRVNEQLVENLKESAKLLEMGEELVAAAKHDRDVLIGAMRSIIEEIERVRSVVPGRVTLDEALVSTKSTAVVALMHIGEEWPGCISARSGRASERA